LAGTETLPIVQSSTTKQVSVSNLTAGRDVVTNSVSVSAGNPLKLNPTGTSQLLEYAGLVVDLQVLGTKAFRVYPPGSGTSELRGDWTTTTSSGGSGNFTVLGNVVQGTAAKGVNFTANTPAAGMTSQLLNWYEEGTFTPVDGSGASLVITVTYARYTRIGRILTYEINLQYPTTTNTNSAIISGLPYNSATNTNGKIIYTTASVSTVTYLSGSGANIYILTPGANVTNAAISGQLFVIQGTYSV
jgi:hypothetical protein